MPRDIAINNDRRTEYDIRGDVRNVTDLDFVTQQVFVGIYETVDMSVPTLQDENIEQQRSAIETAIRRNQFTEQPITVNITNIDYENESVQYSISTRRIDETISAD